LRPQRIIFADYRGACFDVTNLRFYGKGELAACTRDFKEILHLEVIAMGPEQHVGAIEVKIKQVNERIRCHWNTLPFKLSRQLLKYLVMFCISRVTMVVSSRWETGTTESPREMFTNRMLDYKRDLRDCFEDYQQAWTPNHKANSMHSRTNGCIALMPTGNVQGTVRCFQLHHGAIVNRDNFTIIPISDHVSAHLNDLAARDKRPIHPDMSKSEVHMLLDMCHAEILCALDPSYKEYICGGGMIVVRLNKTLHGCTESARLWYEHISQTLIKKIGFCMNRKDACVFIKGHGSKQMVVCVYVDDLMITCTEDEELESIVSSLQKKYSALPISDHVITHLNDLAARDKRPIHPDAVIALGNLENVVNNDVPLREEAYLHPAIDVAREGATVQRADVTAATDLPHITTSVSEKKYIQQNFFQKLSLEVCAANGCGSAGRSG